MPPCSNETMYDYLCNFLLFFEDFSLYQFRHLKKKLSAGILNRMNMVDIIINPTSAQFRQFEIAIHRCEG